MLIKVSVATARLSPPGFQARSTMGASCHDARPDTCAALAGEIAGRLPGRGVPCSAKSNGVGVGVIVGVGLGVGVNVGVRVGAGVLVTVDVNVGDTNGVGVASGVNTWQAGKMVASRQIRIKCR